MKKLLGRQGGFTLVELLVVVGIIVGLAAVIVPTVTRFAGKGETGARAAERDNVQAAIDAYMADQDPPVMTVVGNTGGAATGTNDFTDATGILHLANYLRDPSTNFNYCWDTSGKVTYQQKVSAACTADN